MKLVFNMEGSPDELAEFFQRFFKGQIPRELTDKLPEHQDAASYAVEGSVSGANGSPDVSVSPDTKTAQTSLYSREMVYDALKQYAIRMQAVLGHGNTASCVKGLIRSVAGSTYDGSFPSVQAQYFDALYELAQKNKAFTEDGSEINDKIS